MENIVGKGVVFETVKNVVEGENTGFQHFYPFSKMPS